MSLAEYFGEVLAELAVDDERIFVIDGDLADSDGAQQFAIRHPDKFLMGGIAEQNLVSVAAGMASCGKRPFVFSFAAFLCFRAYDQIRVGLSQSRQPVTLIGSHAGGLTFRNGKTHAALNDIAVISSLPGMQIWAPADRADVDFCIRSLLETSTPAYIRFPRPVPGLVYELPGPASANRWLRPASSINIVGTGLAVDWAIGALANANIACSDIGLLHCPRLHLEESTVAKLSTSHAIFVLEDHYELGGLGAMVKSKLPGIDVQAAAWPANFQGEQGDPEQLRKIYGLCEQGIVSRILRYL